LTLIERCVDRIGASDARWTPLSDDAGRAGTGVGWSWAAGPRSPIDDATHSGQGRRAEATAWIERSLELVEQMALPDLPFRHEPGSRSRGAPTW